MLHLPCFAPLASSPSFPAPAQLPHEDLLSGPEPCGFGTRIQERWREGRAARRRIAALRACPGGRYVIAAVDGNEIRAPCLCSCAYCRVGDHGLCEASS